MGSWSVSSVVNSGKLSPRSEAGALRDESGVEAGGFPPLVPNLHFGTHKSAQLHCADSFSRSRIEDEARAEEEEGKSGGWRAGEKEVGGLIEPGNALILEAELRHHSRPARPSRLDPFPRISFPLFPPLSPV